MKVQVITAPYDSGHLRFRMGRGPEQLVKHGLVDRLRAVRHDVELDSIETVEGVQSEIATTIALYRSLATRIATAHELGRFPLILAGNCGSALAALAAAGSPRPGLVWFDAHGDFNTPETSLSGFLDGMALAMAVGRCWRPLVSTIPGFAPVAEGSVLHVGSRDFELEERALLEASGVAIVAAEPIREGGVREALGPALGLLQSRVDRIHLHLDLDVLDPVATPANAFPAPGGLSPEQVHEAVELAAEHLGVCSASLTSYDPECDRDQHTLAAALVLLERLIAAAEPRPGDPA